MFATITVNVVLLGGRGTAIFPEGIADILGQVGLPLFSIVLLIALIGVLKPRELLIYLAGILFLAVYRVLYGSVAPYDAAVMGAAVFGLIALSHMVYPRPRKDAAQLAKQAGASGRMTDAIRNLRY